MQSFQNWLKENHPDYNEGVGHNIATGLAFALAAGGAGYNALKTPEKPTVSVQQDQDAKDNKDNKGNDLKKKLQSRQMAIKFDDKLCSK